MGNSLHHQISGGECLPSVGHGLAVGVEAVHGVADFSKIEG